MQHFCFWNKEIMRPIQKFGNFSSGLTAFGKLGWLLHNIMIRRTKIEKAADLGLPPRLIYRRSCYFNDEELDFYESLYSESRTTMQAYVEAGTLLNNYAHIFDLLTKMRQAADHPFLVVFGNRLSNSLSCSDVCGICQGEAEDPIISKCHHVFCREDVKEFIDTCPEPSPVCPKCYIPLTIDLEQPTLAPSEKVTSKAALRNRTSILNRMDIGGWKSRSQWRMCKSRLYYGTI
jgi:DNA repair protein RAD16